MSVTTLFPPGAAAGSLPMYYDTTGNYVFAPDCCSSVMTYNADGTIATETLTCPVTALAFRRTYSYTSGAMTSLTGWVKQ